MNEQLTRREALVAALAATALGSGALARPAFARSVASARIGVVLPLSRPARPLDVAGGENVLKTVNLWIDWVNDHGGVGGQQVDRKVYDDKGSTLRGAARVLQAIQKDHCSVILAGWSSAVAQAEIVQAHQLEQKTPFFVSYAWSADVTKVNYPEVVRIGPNNSMLADAFAPFLNERSYRHVAIIAEDTPFGRVFGGTIQATATLAGIDMVAQEYRRDTHDLRPVLKQVLAKKPDALVIAGTVAPAQYLGVTQARAAGYKNDIVLGWDYVDDAFWKATGKRGVGVIWPTFSAPTLHLTPTGLAFKRLFTKKYKRAPEIYQALTWDQLNAWKWAVETAGSVAPADVVPVLPHIDMQGTMGHITLSDKPGTVHFNQWDGVTVYFDQATKKGSTDSTAKLLGSIQGRTP